MRVILKPGGVLLILGALAGLVCLFVFRGGVGGAKTTAHVAGTAKSAAFPGESGSLLTNGDFSDSPSAGWRYANAVPVAVKGGAPDGSEQYLRLPFVPKGDKAWSTMMSQRIARAVESGDRVAFRGWFRSPEPLTITMYVETTESPYKKMVTGQFALTPEWKEYTAVGTIKEEYAAGETQFDIHFGTVPGTVEMANFRLRRNGTDAPGIPHSPDTPASKPSAP